MVWGQIRALSFVSPEKEIFGKKHLKAFLSICRCFLRCRPWKWASLEGVCTDCCDCGDFRANMRRVSKPSTMACSVWSLSSPWCLMFALAAIQCTEGKRIPDNITDRWQKRFTGSSKTDYGSLASHTWDTISTSAGGSRFIDAITENGSLMVRSLMPGALNTRPDFWESAQAKLI